MASKDLYIIRHGQTEFNRKQLIQGRGIDAPLNETGFRQARAAGEVMRAVGPAAVRSSSLIRARQTALEIVHACGLDPRTDFAYHPELDEMDFGELEGMPATGSDPKLVSLLENWRLGRGRVAAHGGESPEQVFERAHPCVLRIMSSSDPSPVVLVLHGRLIRILLCQWLGLGYQGMADIHHHNAGIHHLRWHMDRDSAATEGGLVADGNAIRIESVYMNRTDHLNGLSEGSQAISGDAMPTGALR